MCVLLHAWRTAEMGLHNGVVSSHTQTLGPLMSRHFLALKSFFFQKQQQLLAVSNQIWRSRAGCCIDHFNRVLYCHVSVQYSRTTLWLL